MDASRARGAPLTGTWRSAHFMLHVAPLGAVQASPDKHAGQGPEACTLIGVVCPKRLAKRAVTRNTIKRQIYAVSSELQAQLPHAGLVVRLHAGFSAAEFRSATSRGLKSAVRAELMELLQRPAFRALAPLP